MEIKKFSFLSNPKLIFGTGRFKELPQIISGSGSTILIITGSSLKSSGKWEALESWLTNNGIRYYEFIVQGEPSPDIIDYVVSEFKNKSIHLVVSIGGGSVMDTGKAVSAMLPQNESVMEYLEGLGNKQHNGIKAPFIAVPTTSGTGSEATKNAVLSRIGKNGFKKSLRHDNFIPDIALIDPELTLSCPPEVTAASGMDAFSQLLESYLSAKSSPITDALSLSGLEAVKYGLLQSYEEGSDIQARSLMSYAAYLSGLTLANAGLGTVHGIAGVIGGYFEMPHGVVCGTMMAAVNRINIMLLKNQNDPDSIRALEKYAIAGRLFSDCQNLSQAEACDFFINKLESLTERFNLPKLSDFGIKNPDIDKIVDEADCKNNPVLLNKEELKTILMSRI